MVNIAIVGTKMIQETRKILGLEESVVVTATCVCLL